MNPVNKIDNKYFQYVITVALNYEQIKKDPKRITKINIAGKKQITHKKKMIGKNRKIM